jgi:hypothetical protein
MHDMIAALQPTTSAATACVKLLRAAVQGIGTRAEACWRRMVDRAPNDEEEMASTCAPHGWLGVKSWTPAPMDIFLVASSWLHDVIVSRLV